MTCVRSVVGGDGIDGSVAQAFFEGRDIRWSTQRLIDFEHRIKTSQSFISQCEVMRSGFGGDRQTFGLSATHHLNAAFGGQMQEVNS